MSDQPREPLEQKTPINALRLIVRTFVIVTGVLLLSGAVFLTSRYRANQRLMKVEQEFDRGVVVEWNEADLDWLNEVIGDERALALLGRPVALTVGGRGKDAPDQTVQRLLGELSGLERIAILNRLVPPGCLEAIATRHRVKYLSFQLRGIDHDDARWLSRMPQLEHVDLTQLSGNSDANDWSWLNAAPRLERLDAFLGGGTVVPDKDVIALAECHSLKDLSLAGGPFSDEALVRLCDLPALENLNLRGNDLRLHFPPGRTLPVTLRYLSLAGKSLDDESLAAVAGLPVLEYLDVNGGSLTDAGLAAVAKLPAIRLVYFSGQEGFTDAGIAHLVQSQTLTRISFVQESCLTSQALVHLLSIPHWTDIQFKNVSFHRESGEASPSVTPDTVDEFISQRRKMQEKQDSARNRQNL